MLEIYRRGKRVCDESEEVEGAYGVLVAVKPSVIETAVCVADAERQRWIIRIGSKIVDEV